MKSTPSTLERRMLGSWLSTLSDKTKALFYRVKAVLIQSRNYTAKPGLSDLLNDPLVEAELRRSWFESNPHALEVAFDQPGSRKCEQGGWIVWSKQTTRLFVVRVASGSRAQLLTIVGTRPDDNDEQEVVAWFHTHPNTIAEGYSQSPGPGDIGFTNRVAKVPGILETHEGRKVVPYP